MNEDCFGADVDTQVRALAFYDNFEARVSRDGVPMYFYCSEFVQDFVSAPEIVAMHPMLAEASSLIQEAFDNAAFVGDMMRRVKGNASAEEVEEPHRAFICDFDDRAFALFETLRPKLNSEILTNLEAYVVIERPLNLAGVGVEALEVGDGKRRWNARFEDNFPIGPNVHAAGFVRFSADRLRVEYDAFGGRQWIDFRTGEHGEVKLSDI